MKTTVTGVEMFRKLLDQGQAGDNVGVLLRGIEREDVERGQVLCKPGSIKPHTKFKAEAYILTKEEGGRHTPFFTNYRPQFYFRTTDVTGVVTLPEGTEMVMPGDNVTMDVELIAPIAMEEKLRFAIREGGRTVGAGVVAKIIGIIEIDGEARRQSGRFLLFEARSRHERSEHPHPPQGVRPSHPRCVDARDRRRRRSGPARRCAGRSRCRRASSASP